MTIPFFPEDQLAFSYDFQVTTLPHPTTDKGDNQSGPSVREAIGYFQE